MEYKTILAIISTIVFITAFIPYLKDTFSLRTKPHAYTWLIWSITQGTAVTAIWVGGGGWGGLGLTAGLVTVIIVFLFSLKYGSKNITKFDTIVLISALLAILVWWQLDQPLLAVLMVSLIDILGYIPTIRKSFQEPWSETVLSWIGFTVAYFLSIAALEEYNLMTLTYIISISAANIVVIMVCLARRRYIKPVSP